MSGEIDASSIQVRQGFLNSLWNHRPATPLTAYEETVAQNMDTLRAYYDYDLIDKPVPELVQELESKISPRDLLYLMIDAYDMEAEGDAADIIDIIRAQDNHVSTAALEHMLSESVSGTIVPALLIGLVSDEVVEEKPVTRLPSGLNLDAMKQWLDEA